MTLFRDHRIGLVGGTLAIAPGVSMDVGNNFKLMLATVVPNHIHFGAVEHDHPLQGIRIDVVIRQELGDAPLALFPDAQQKTTALDLTAATRA